jgi:hypothetical protein
MNQATENRDLTGIQDGVAQLIGAVIGCAVEPENIKRLANGRMNRPEHRGGESIEWLNSKDGEFWLNLAEQAGIETVAIRQIARNPIAYGYDGIGHGEWGATG